jgi:hypothetical protein
LQSKFTKSAMLIRAKKFVFKNSIWVQKNAEFHADFESVEKSLKKCTRKKFFAKTHRKYALFSLLLMFVKLVLLITFLLHFLTILHQKKVLCKNAPEICTFLTFAYVRQTCFAYNFFVAFFNNFFNGFEISVKFSAFLTPFFGKKKIV